MTAVREPRTTGARPTDDQLLDAARAVFVERGFHATTMADISERANSTKPTLYAHFGGKDVLYDQLLRREAEVCRAHLFNAYAAAASLALREQTRADVTAFFEYAEGSAEGFELLFGARNGGTSISVRDELVESLVDQIAQRLMDFRAGTVGRTPTWREHQLAAMLVGSTITAAQHARSTGEDLQQAVRLASSFAIAALENLPPAR